MLSRLPFVVLKILLAMQTEIEAIRDDIAPTWLQASMSLEQTADKFVRPSLQKVGLTTAISTLIPYSHATGLLHLQVLSILNPQC